MDNNEDEALLAAKRRVELSKAPNFCADCTPENTTVPNTDGKLTYQALYDSYITTGDDLPGDATNAKELMDYMEGRKKNAS